MYRQYKLLYQSVRLIQQSDSNRYHGVNTFRLQRSIKHKSEHYVCKANSHINVSVNERHTDIASCLSAVPYGCHVDCTCCTKPPPVCIQDQRQRQARTWCQQAHLRGSIIRSRRRRRSFLPIANQD